MMRPPFTFWFIQICHFGNFDLVLFVGSDGQADKPQNLRTRAVRLPTAQKFSLLRRIRT